MEPKQILSKIVFLFVVTSIFHNCCAVDPSDQFNRLSDGISVKLKEGVLTLKFCTEKSIRVLYAPLESQAGRKSLMTVKEEWSPVKWDLKRDNNFLNIFTEKICVQIDLETGALSFYNEEDRVILEEPSGGGKTLRPAKVLGEDVYSVQQEFILNENEGIYGLGQHQNGLFNYRGHDVLLAQSNTVAIIPFLVSSRGYGILWDNYSLTRFHDGQDGTYLWSEIADAVDYYFIYGPEIDDIISAYRTITGQAPLFGKWAYGYWQSKERYKNQEELIGTVRKYRNRRIPLDSIVQDWQYWGDLGWNAMDFDKTIFPDPEGMIKTLHETYNAHIMISVWPAFARRTAIHREMDSKGFLYPKPHFADGHVYDAFNEKARQLYWEWMNKGLFSKGIDAWWLDSTEPSFKNAETQESWIQAVKANKQTTIGSWARYLNAFSLVTTKGVYENQRASTSDKRVFILTRSAYAGQQRYAAVTWSGDISAKWEIFKAQIPAGLNFCMAGIPYWTTDIGGFWVNTHGASYSKGNKDKDYRELYLRWFQFGTFCPIFRSHGTYTSREVWYFGEPGSRIYETLLSFLHLRYRLFPYIYSLAWKITNEGYTMLRGLPFDFRTDSRILNIGDQFMFGSSLLVNPVTEPRVDSRSVYLPEAPGWIDFWTGKSYKGGQIINAHAPIETIPLFVLAGSIIPMGPRLQFATEKPATPIELRVYPGTDGNFLLYEDENDNYNYEDGVFSTILFTWDDSRQILTIGKRLGSFPGMLKERVFKVVIVKEHHGVGIGITSKVDRTVEYSGEKVVLYF